jgi:hypothetical protein
MTDIRSPRWLCIKGLLFVLLGCLASATLLVLHPSLLVAGLLVLAIWAFARAYYFAFYVIEHYIDGRYKFAGLLSAARYLLGRRDGSKNAPEEDRPSRGEG